MLIRRHIRDKPIGSVRLFNSEPNLAVPQPYHLLIGVLIENIYIATTLAVPASVEMDGYLFIT